MPQHNPVAGSGKCFPGEAVCVRHACRGRVRLGVRGLKRATELGELLSTGLGKINGVRGVRASTTTGNVVILFDPEAVSPLVLTRVANALVSGELGPGRGGLAGAAWHTMSVQAVAEGLMTSAQAGLSHSEAAERLAEHGRNVTVRPLARSRVGILADQLRSFPVAILAGAALISLATGALLEAAAIAAVVALNSAIGYVSEARAEHILSSLTDGPEIRARTLREGRVHELSAEELVPGDVILLQRGDLVPADARLVQAAGLSVSESALTGESLPVLKTVDALPTAALPLADRTNMVYRGTVVTGGSASAIIVATGTHTEFGRVQRLVAHSRPPMTPMQIQMDRLGQQLVWMIGAALGVIVLIGLLRGHNVYRVLRSALALAVAAIPEGLPMTATAALANSVQRMRQRGMVVRRIDAVETLASVDVVCFDKTGTLTFNKMSVAELASGGRRVQAHELTALKRDRLDTNLRRLFEIACLCSEVELQSDGTGALRIEGSGTETALVRAAMDAGFDPRQIRARHPLSRIQHRSEAYRFMATLHHSPGGSLVAVKGDAIEVISRCKQVLEPDGQVRSLTEADRASALQANDEMASRALRVLGFAYAEIIGRSDKITAEDLTWVGLAGLADPVRPGVGEVLKRLEKAGVRSIILTGDAPVTARAVAAEIGLGNGRELRVLTADELDRLEPGERANCAATVDVFARVSPAQKLEIVRALQSSGAIVAMLGDGINDSPALRAAHVGLAVGRNGHAAAREVADIFLEVEDLRLLLCGIEEGRATQDNVRRSLQYLLGTNSSEVLWLLAGSAIGSSEPLSPAQLLWINLITDVLPGIALTLEPHEAELIARKPQRPEVPIIGSTQLPGLLRESGILAGSALLSSLAGAVAYGKGSRQSQTMAFASLVVSQLLHALNCRALQPTNGKEQPWSALGCVVYGSLAAQGVATALPATRLLLGLVPIGPAAIGVVLVSALTSFLLLRNARKHARTGASQGLHFVRGAAR